MKITTVGIDLAKRRVSDAWSRWAGEGGAAQAAQAQGCGEVLRQTDGVGPVLAQHAFFTQYVSNTQNALFHVAGRAVPGPTGLAAFELHPVAARAGKLRQS
jgi:hypothetical protein